MTLERHPYLADWRPDDVLYFADALSHTEQTYRDGDCGSATFRYNRPVCRFKVPTETSGEFRAQVCAGCRQFVIDQEIRRANLPKRHIKLLDELQATSARERVAEWLARFPECDRGLLLVGPTGTGKTQLVVSAAYEIILSKQSEEEGVPYRPRYESVPILADKARDWEKRPKLPSEEIAPPHLLILDDIGAEHSTEYSVNWLSMLLDGWYTQGRLLLATTNCSPDTLKVHIGERGVSRLYEMTDLVFVEGEDRRRRKVREGGAA